MLPMQASALTISSSNSTGIATNTTKSIFAAALATASKERSVNRMIRSS